MAGFDPTFGRKPKVPVGSTPSLVNQYKVADAATTTQAADYDRIMQGYQDTFSNLNTPGSVGTYNPTISPYTNTADYMSSINRLKGLAETGGYSDASIADLRERGISPIRSVYANAQRDINRRNTASGGVSANYNALKSRMAREESSKIADQVTSVNAAIADKVAGNKIGVATSLGGLTAGEQSERNRHGLATADMQNDASRFNAGRQDINTDSKLRALSGMSSLYGTTPALTNTFGNQALQGAQLQNTINQQNIGTGLNLIGKNLIKPGGFRPSFR